MRPLLTLFTLLLLAATALPTPSPTESSSAPRIGQFVLYAERSIRISSHSHAEGGDVGVRTPRDSAKGTEPPPAQLQLEEHGKCGNAFSPSTSLETDAEMRKIWTNSLKRASDTEIGAQGKFPGNMPPLPLAIASGAGADVTVAEHRTESLKPGTYGALVLHEDSTLHLEAGRYNFVSVKLRERSQLLGERGGNDARAAAIDLRIAGGLELGEHARIAPHWDDAKAKDFTIAVAGSDPASITGPTLGPPTSRTTPTTVVSFGKEAHVHALLAAPHGTIWMGEESSGKGAFAAFDIVTGEGVEVEFESGFPASSPGQQGSQQLHGYLKAPMSSAPLIGPVRQDDILNISIGLPLRDPQGLATFIKQASNPTSPTYRQWLTPAQFTGTYGPPAADYQALTTFAQSNELSVTETFPSNLLLRVSGTAAAIERAFYININKYARPDHSPFFALDREPSLDLALPVLRISGLDNYLLPAPLQSGSGQGGGFQGNDFRNAYLGANSTCSSLTGSGQSIGLFELDGFDPNDIKQYETMAGLPNVTISPVIIPFVTGGSSSSFSSALTRLEVASDIEMVAAMAPGATITPFMAPALGGTDPTNAVLHAMARPPLVPQISFSWITDADDNTFQAAAQLAAQGQSMFFGSGDNGAYNGFPPVGLTNAIYPYATVVGGTTLSMNGGGASWASETTWTGSGGGFLQYPGLDSFLNVPIPDYQVPFINVANGGSNQFQNVPDVSIVANFVLCVSGGQVVPCAGTSLSGPLWAGFVALMNQQGRTSAAPPVGFINPALYAVASTAEYTSTFHDINDASTNSNNGKVTGFPAVTGYDLATGLGTPQCGLIPALVGGQGGGGGGGGGSGTVNVSATETQIGPDVCVNGAGFVPGGHVKAEYFGIPGRVAPMAGLNSTVKPDGSFDMGIDTGTEFLQSVCNNNEIQNTVTITVTEKDASNNVIGSGNGGMPGAYWCANAPVSTNLNGGCH